MSLRDRSNDEALLLDIARGEHRAFERFYQRHQAAIISYHLRRTSNRELAFDLTAETFAAVIVASPRFDPSKGNAVGWLFGIASNKLTDSLRRGEVESEARVALAMQAVVVTEDDLDRVDELASRADEPSIAAMLEKVPESQRAAIVARVIDERPYEDIAAEMQCSTAVVRQRVARGLNTLRQEMGEVR